MERKEYIDLLKWVFAGLFGFIFVTKFDQYIKGRETSLAEMTLYSNYVNDAIILNPEVNARWQLAHFYSRIITQEDVRERWIAYYQELDSLRRRYELKRDSLNEVLRNDSGMGPVMRFQLNKQLQYLDKELETTPRTREEVIDERQMDRRKQALITTAMLRVQQGHGEDASELLDHASELDPGDPILIEAGQMLRRDLDQSVMTDVQLRNLESILLIRPRLSQGSVLR